MVSGPITSWQIDGETGNSVRLYFGGSKIIADGDCSHKIKRRFLLGRKAITNLDSISKSKDIILPTKVHLVKVMAFPSCVDVRVDYKESWALKNWCFWTVVLEQTLENLLDCKENKPVHPKGNQSWIFNGRTDAEAETPILWPPDVKNWLTGKDPDDGKDWRGERGEGDNRGWDGWMASLTRWTWVWASSGSWWWTGKPGVLQSTRSQRVGHDWATELTDVQYVINRYKLLYTKDKHQSNKDLLYSTGSYIFNIV